LITSHTVVTFGDLILRITFFETLGTHSYYFVIVT